MHTIRNTLLSVALAAATFVPTTALASPSEVRAEAATGPASPGVVTTVAHAASPAAPAATVPAPIATAPARLAVRHGSERSVRATRRGHVGLDPAAGMSDGASVVHLDQRNSNRRQSVTSFLQARVDVSAKRLTARKRRAKPHVQHERFEPDPLAFLNH